MSTPGGQMTDWGAHHMDIAQWGIGELPVKIETTSKMPNVKDGYNVALDFSAKYTYPSGVRVMTVLDTGRNGIMFTGSDGRIFVNRGTIDGKPVEDLAENPLPSRPVQSLRLRQPRSPRAGRQARPRLSTTWAISSIVSASGGSPFPTSLASTRSVSTCHLGNISMHVGPYGQLGFPKPRPFPTMPRPTSSSRANNAKGLRSRSTSSVVDSNTPRCAAVYLRPVGFRGGPTNSPSVFLGEHHDGAVLAPMRKGSYRPSVSFLCRK